MRLLSVKPKEAFRTGTWPSTTLLTLSFFFNTLRILLLRALDHFIQHKETPITESRNPSPFVLSAFYWNARLLYSTQGHPLLLRVLKKSCLALKSKLYTVITVAQEHSKLGSGEAATARKPHNCLRFSKNIRIILLIFEEASHVYIVQTRDKTIKKVGIIQKWSKMEYWQNTKADCVLETSNFMTYRH